MPEEDIISVPECTNLIENLSVIINCGEFNEDKTKIINVKKVKQKSTTNYFFDEKTLITSECFRFYDKLNLFSIDGENILIKENGKILFEHPNNFEIWYGIISKRLWDLFKPQLEAVFIVIEKLQNENQELYKSKINERFYIEFKSQPSFFYKGKERSRNNMDHKSNNILSFLSKVKVLRIKKFKGSTHLVQVNKENLRKYFPKLNYGTEKKTLNSQKEVWDYLSFIQIILENFKKLPSAGDWKSIKGVDYYKLRETSIKILSEKKKIDNPIFTFDDLLKDISKTYRRDFIITAYMDDRKIVRITNPTLDNFSRKIPRKFN